MMNLLGKPHFKSGEYELLNYADNTFLTVKGPAVVIQSRNDFKYRLDGVNASVTLGMAPEILRRPSGRVYQVILFGRETIALFKAFEAAGAGAFQMDVQWFNRIGYR